MLKAVRRMHAWPTRHDVPLGASGQPASDGGFDVLLGQPAVTVVAGDFFACALLVDGSVRCWAGENDCDNGTCKGPAQPFDSMAAVLGGGIEVVTANGASSYGPWRAIDLGTILAP